MKYPFFLLLLAILILATGCSPGTEGIFASIEREQKVQSLGGMNKYATITSMAELTASTPHRYFATGGRALFTRPLGAVQWDQMKVGGNAEILSVGSVTDALGTGKAVFAIAGGTLWQNTNGTEAGWTSVFSTIASGGDTPVTLIPIRSTDGKWSQELLVVTTNVSNSYQNVYRINTTDGTTMNVTAPLNLASAAGMGTLSTGVTSAATDGTNYYLVNQSFLWTVNSSFTSATKITVSGVDHVAYQGVLYLGTTLYLSTMSNAGSGGGLYTVGSPSGGGFSFGKLTSDSTEVDKNSYPVWFTQFLYNQRNTSIWIATYSSTYTQGTGYMEYSSGTLHTTPITSENNYNSTVLPTSAVGVLFADYEGPNYFLGTLSQGLWQWSGTGSSATWVQQ